MFTFVFLYSFFVYNSYDILINFVCFTDIFETLYSDNDEDLENADENEGTVIPHFDFKINNETLTLHLDVNNEVFRSGESFSHYVTGFFETVAGSLNGKTVAKEKEITAVVEIQRGMILYWKRDMSYNLLIVFTKLILNVI